MADLSQKPIVTVVSFPLSLSPSFVVRLSFVRRRFHCQFVWSVWSSSNFYVKRQDEKESRCVSTGGRLKKVRSTDAVNNRTLFLIGRGPLVSPPFSHPEH